MSRLKVLRSVLNWSQPKLAAFLATSQPSVWRMENSGLEKGQAVLLLNLLEDGVARGVVAAGMTPDEARTRLGLDAPVGEIAQ